MVLMLEVITGRRRRAIEARRAERERIARDLHDTLLQGTQALLFRLQMWEQDPDIPEALRQEIAAVVRQTQSMVIEGRERILMIRRADERPPDLAQALAAMGHEVARGRGATFEVEVAGKAKRLTQEATRQLIDIAREAVRNAYQHAQATRIVIDLQYRRRSLVMRIADNGNGIDPVILESRVGSSHFGLTGMRERAGELGGRLKVQSQPGAGTAVEVVVAARIAFRGIFTWPW